MDVDKIQLTESYEKLKMRVEKSPEIVASVSEVILLDVQRSEEQLPGVESETLMSILKAYAIYNPEIEYCQGMNYLAGLLLLVFKDADVAFKALITLVDRFGIAEMFNQEFPRLKMFFYQIDRLLGLVDEEL